MLLPTPKSVRALANGLARLDDLKTRVKAVSSSEAGIVVGVFGDESSKECERIESLTRL